MPNPSGEAQLFVTDTDILAPVGGGDTDVGVTAAEAGTAANGSFGEADLVTDIDGIDTVVVTEAQGGADPKDDDAYLDRATDLMTLLAPRPILPEDHAVLAGQVPGVGRATAIDLYIPATSSAPVGDTDAPEYTGTAQTGVPRTTPSSSPPRTAPPPTRRSRPACSKRFDSQREVNFLNFVIGPTYTTIDVHGDRRLLPRPCPRGRRPGGRGRGPDLA